MMHKFTRLAGAALILGAAATVWGSELTGVVALRSGPSFMLGYRVGRFLPAFGLGLSDWNDVERIFFRESTGAPESSYTRSAVSLSLNPELGTRIYLGSQAGGTGGRLTPYVWASALAGFYTMNRYINDQPDTAHGTATQPPYFGGRVGAGAELQVLPKMSLNGEVGLSGASHSYREEYTEWSGYYSRYEDSGFSLSVYTGLGVNFHF